MGKVVEDNIIVHNPNSPAHCDDYFHEERQSGLILDTFQNDEDINTNKIDIL